MDAISHTVRVYVVTMAPEVAGRIREIEFQIKDGGTNGLKVVNKPVLGGSHRVHQLGA